MWVLNSSLGFLFLGLNLGRHEAGTGRTEAPSHSHKTKWKSQREMAQGWLPGDPVCADGIAGLATQGPGQLPGSLLWASPQSSGVEGQGGDKFYDR